MKGVVPNAMTLRDHTPDDFGMAFHLLGDDEKLRVDTAIAQNLEQTGSEGGSAPPSNLSQTECP